METIVHKADTHLDILCLARSLLIRVGQGHRLELYPDLHTVTWVLLLVTRLEAGGHLADGLAQRRDHQAAHRGRAGRAAEVSPVLRRARVALAAGRGANVLISTISLHNISTLVCPPPAEAAADPEAAGTGAVRCSPSAGALGAGVAGACSKVIQGHW